MPDVSDLHNTEKATKELSKALRERLSPLINEWQWEARFNALQGAFSVDKSASVQQILGSYFNQTWTAKSIKKAPHEVKKQAGVFAALNKAQVLYVHSDMPDLLAAWWPWGHGATISVRLFQAGSTEWRQKRGLFARLFG